jgi:hypothetical protein
MAQERPEPVTVEAEAPKLPETKKLDYDPVANATIAMLTEAEKDLKTYITGAVADETQKTLLLARIAEDSELVKEKSEPALNDQDTTPLFLDAKPKDKSKGLADRQSKTAKIFEEIKNEAVKKDALKKLAAVHNIRRTLFDHARNDEEQAVYDRSYQLFNHMLGRDLNQVTARPMGAPASSSLRSELGGPNEKTQPSFKGNGLEISFTNGGNNAHSNNPVLLGIGMVAAGHKKITFSAKHPEIALRAAEAALDAGAEDFKFDEHTMQLLLKPEQPYYTSSALQHKHFNDWYDRLRKRVDAVKFGKLKSTNRIFNEGLNKSEEHSHTFGQFSTPKDHREYLKTLMPEEQAQLAMKLDERNKEATTKSTYPLKGADLDAPQYIARLVSDEQLEGEPPAETTAPPFVKKEAKFLEHYENLEKAKVKDIPASIDEVEQFNELRTSAARANFYQKINALPTIPVGPNGEPNRNDPKIVRAAYIGALLDRAYKRLEAFSQYSPQYKEETKNLSTEIKNLMNGVSTEDQAATANLFRDNYHRAQALVLNNNDNVPGATKVTKVTDNTHLHPGTYNLRNAEGGQYQGRRLIKDDKGLALYQKLVESYFTGVRHLAQPIAPAVHEPNPANPPPRPDPVNSSPRRNPANQPPANQPEQGSRFEPVKKVFALLFNKIRSIEFGRESLALFVNKVGSLFSSGVKPNPPADANQANQEQVSIKEYAKRFLAFAGNRIGSLFSPGENPNLPPEREDEQQMAKREAEGKLAEQAKRAAERSSPAVTPPPLVGEGSSPANTSLPLAGEGSSPARSLPLAVEGSSPAAVSPVVVEGSNTDDAVHPSSSEEGDNSNPDDQSTLSPRR